MLALAIASLANAQTVVEVEPNNNARQATQFDPTLVLSGQIETQDSDFFRFTVDDDQQIRDFEFELEATVKVDLCLFGADGVRIKCSRSTSTVFKELSLQGEYVLSLSPVAKMAVPVAYQLRASTSRPLRAHHEVEPNDRWEDANPLSSNSEMGGHLAGNEYDSFNFRVDGARQLWSIVAAGDAVSRLELRSRTGIKLHSSSSESGQVRMDNLQLPQGDYAVRLTGNSKSEERQYRLRLASFGSPDDAVLNEIAPEPEASRPAGKIEAEPNDSNGQADRLSFDTSHIGMLSKSDSDMYRFFLPGHGRVRIEVVPATGGKISFSLDAGASVSSATPGQIAVFEGALLPGDHYLRIRSRPSGTGFYRLTMTQLDPLAALESSLDNVSIALPDNLPVLAAYAPIGQRLTIAMKLDNNGTTQQSLDIVAHSSAHSWRLTPEQHTLMLAPGQSRQVDVTLEVLADARSDQPVLLSLGARNAAGAMTSKTLVLEAACNGSPHNPAQLWPLPKPLLGHINAAFLGLGAEVVNPKRRDADAFDGIVSRSRGAWGRADETITIDLAGDAELTVLGTIIHPAGSGKRGPQLKQFEMLTSVDGVNFVSAFEGELTADAAEQAFVFATPVKAKFAQIRLKNNHIESSNEITLGEWKVIVSESAATITGRPLDVADNAIGGYDVYSNPFAGASSRHDTFSTVAADGQFPRDADTFEWVMAFHDNRAARITELRWIDDAQRGHPDRDIVSTNVALSMESPLGPWQDIGAWDLQRGDAGVEPLPLTEPVWARYIRFNAPPIENGKPPNAPQHIAVIEQKASDVYRSAIGEWGYTSRAAIFEFLNPRPQENAVRHHDAADQRERATVLTEGKLASGEVLVGEDVDWYAIDVPAGSNQLRLLLSGNPGVEYAFEIQDAAGTTLESGIDSTLGLEITLDVSPGRYYLKLFERPRSIIFSWDTSGSVGPYYDVIDQTMKSFALGVKDGREEVNLQPFSDPEQRFLLDDWSGDTAVVSGGIVNSDRKFSSSNVESSLIFSSKELTKRIGTRAVLLITDAQTDGFRLTDDLWGSLQQSRPRVFSFEISSAGSPTAQNIMQSYADINNGFYDQVLSAGDLQVGFDRAICMLRRPKPYHVRAYFDAVAEKPHGSLLVELDEGDSNAGDAVEVILDASGSMYQQLDGRFRYEIAKEVLDDLVATTLPENIGFALRVFGNREPSSCRTDLELELEPLDRDKARAVISAIEPQQFAYTPIADSLARVASDLDSVSGRRTVVLVTDGEESCDGDVEATIKKLKSSGIDVQLNVIGFDFVAADKEAARDRFRQWADLGGGEYYDAANATELAQSLALAVNVPSHYDVLTIGGDVVVAGVPYGELVELRPGRYRLSTPDVPVATQQDVVVRSSKTTTVQLKP